MARLSVFQHRLLAASVIIWAVIVSTSAATGDHVRLPDGIGEALVIDYQDQWREQYPDCAPETDRTRITPETNSLLVVMLDGSPARMTAEEFRARRGAANRALAEVWPVADCARRLPAFEEGSIERIRPEDLTG